MHVLPQLRELEKRFAAELVVVGVHSGKFRAERETGNIAQAMRRLGVEHPVVNDRQYRIWRSYGVGAWPTVVLIDPAGDYVGTLPGEFEADQLAPLIGQVIARFDADDAPTGVRLRRGPFTSVSRVEPEASLRFPGKVIAPSADCLFVADSGHQRIMELQVELEGWRRGKSGSGESGGGPVAHVARTIGSGRRGAGDGAFDSAGFDRPLGMALKNETLYVADSENHAIRAADLRRGAVTTLVGTGRQARRANEPGVGTDMALSSPWDVAVHGEVLVVAMAGLHQLWRVDLVTLETGPAVGTGREDITDGPALRCTLAQPTGLHVAGDRIFFADSESSAVRVVEEGRHGPEVRTIVGKGLFDFGDEDGKGGHVRLQHPYDVVAHEGALYVADTYNNKVKRIDAATGVTETFLGDGEEGAGDGEALVARFDEPEGLAVADGLLFIADTNNHALRVTDLREGAPRYRQVETLRIDE